MSARIDSRDLELVSSIAEHGSLTGAARRLHVTQPAISQRLANLRERIAADPFDRRHGEMRANAVGERLVQASTAVRREIDAALADIDAMLRRREQRLRVTTQCYTCYRWLPFVIRDMHNAFPDLSLDAVPEATDSPYDALRDDRIDIAVVSNPCADSGFEEHQLFCDELYAVMSDRHPLASRRFLNPSNFADQTLVLYTGAKHAICEEVLYPAGVAPGRIVQVRITEAIVELARAGSGVAVLAGWVFNDLPDKRGLAAVRITRQGFRRTWLAVVNNRSDGRYVAPFVSSLREIGEVLDTADWRDTLAQGV